MTDYARSSAVAEKLHKTLNDLEYVFKVICGQNGQIIREFNQKCINFQFSISSFQLNCLLFSLFYTFVFDT